MTAHGVGGLGLGCRLGILGSGKLLAELGKLCLDLLVLELEVVVSSLLTSANSSFDHLFLGHLSRFLGHIGLLLLNNQFGGLRCLIGRLYGILHGYLHVRLLTAWAADSPAGRPAAPFIHIRRGFWTRGRGAYSSSSTTS